MLKKLLSEQEKERFIAILDNYREYPKNYKELLSIWDKRKSENIVICDIFKNGLTISQPIEGFLPDKQIKNLIENWQYNHNTAIDITVDSVKSGYTANGQKISRYIRAELLKANYPNIDKSIADFSRIIESSKIKCYMHISANPAEYLLASDNTTGWTSCYSLDDKGCCHLGTLSYLLDSNTIIVYTTKNEDPYSTKISRAWCHIGEEMYCLNTFYPSENQVLKNGFIQFMDKFIEGNLISIQAGNYKDYFIMPPNVKGYIDILYKPFTIIKSTYISEKIKIGRAKIPCPFHPGEYSENNESLCCRDAGYRCVNCGEYYGEDDIYFHNDNCYCADCFHSNFTYCEHCQEYGPNEDMTYIESSGEYVCEYCLNKLFTRCEDCGEYHETDNMYSGYHDGYEICLCESCFNANYTECYECGEYHHENDMREVTLPDGEKVSICEICIKNSYDIILCPCCDEYIKIN